MKRSDRLLGIALGLVIGVVAVILFVNLGGTEAIDDPSLESGQSGAVEQGLEGR